LTSCFFTQHVVHKQTRMAPGSYRPSRDLTLDFRQHIETLTGFDGKRRKFEEDTARKSRPMSNFMMTATHIAEKIASTADKLKTLSMMSKKKSLFDDKTVEINELTFVIKKEIRDLQRTLQELERTHGKQRGSHSLSHQSNVVGCLDADLNKIVKAFSKILEERSESIQEQQKRRYDFNFF
jgi:syntaxin 5